MEKPLRPAAACALESCQAAADGKQSSASALRTTALTDHGSGGKQCPGGPQDQILLLSTAPPLAEVMEGARPSLPGSQKPLAETGGL